MGKGGGDRDNQAQVEFRAEIISMICERYVFISRLLFTACTGKHRKCIKIWAGNLNFDAKWCQNGVWAPSGAKMGGGREKRCHYLILATHFGSLFPDVWAPFWESFFDAFLEGLFFASWATFGRQGPPKERQNGAKMVPKASLGAPSGMCENHGRGYVFST